MAIIPPRAQWALAGVLLLLACASVQGETVGPDDATRYTSIEDAKVTALKQLQDAKADPLAAFTKWLADNRRPYTADSEEGKRVFARLLDLIETGIEHNSDPETLSAVGLTSHLDKGLETTRGKGGERHHRRSVAEATPKSVGIDCTAMTYDNREYLTPVEDEGWRCRADWAFAVTTAMQAQWYGANWAKLPSLSAQQLVDCAVSSEALGGTNEGCLGGSMEIALEYVKKEGLMLESDYPYEMTSYHKASDSPRMACRTSSKTGKKRYTFDSYSKFTNEGDMLESMCHGKDRAIMIELYACDALLNYQGGIITGDCAYAPLSDKPYDNNVYQFAIVGFGSEKDPKTGAMVPYWLVRTAFNLNLWGDSAYPGHFRIKRGAGLAGITKNAISLGTPTLKPDAAPCLTSTAWMGGVYTAWRRTNYTKYWAVAMKSDSTTCKDSYTSPDRTDRAAAEKDVLANCAKYYSAPCTLMKSAQAACTNATRIAELKTWAEGQAKPGQSYAVAVNGTCGTPFIRVANAGNWTHVNGVVKDCNAGMAKAYGTNTSSPCGILFNGTKPATPVVSTKCTNATAWAKFKGYAINNTDWGYAWAVAADPKCGHQYDAKNFTTLDKAKAYINYTSCHNASAAELGPNSCSLVEVGVATCTDSSSWRETLMLALKEEKVAKKWLAVFSDKTCTFRTYIANANTEAEARQSTKLAECNKLAVAAGMSARSCGVVKVMYNWGVA